MNSTLVPAVDRSTLIFCEDGGHRFLWLVVNLLLLLCWQARLVIGTIQCPERLEVRLASHGASLCWNLFLLWVEPRDAIWDRESNKVGIAS